MRVAIYNGYSPGVIHKRDKCRLTILVLFSENCVHYSCNIEKLIGIVNEFKIQNCEKDMHYFAFTDPLKNNNLKGYN